MVSLEPLEITGYGNAPVPNIFFWQTEKTRHLAILFPGLGYSSHMPMLYYPGRLLVLHGADVLRVEYAYDRNPDFHSLSAEERSRWLHADAEAAFSRAWSQREYDQITLVGKSIGTLAVGYLLTTHPKVREPRCVWLTPLLRNDELKAQIVRTRHRSLFVIGTADPHYDPVTLGGILKATGGESIVIDHADHSMEIQGDLQESIRVLQRIMLGIQGFLGGGEK